MRILQISSATAFGGGEKHLIELSRALADRGHSVSAVVRPACGFKERLSEVPFKDILELPLRGSFDPGSVLGLSRVAKRTNADIIHAHLARDYITAALACRLAPGAHLVLTRHVLFPVSFATGLFLGNAAGVIAVSEGVRESLKKTFPDRKIFSIPNGIRIERFASAGPESGTTFRAEHGIQADRPLIVSVGELKPLKGQEDLLIAASEVKRSFPEALFLIVGKDNSAGSAFRRKLRRLASALGLESNIMFLEWVDDTAPMLAAADLFVSASLSESFGLAILEAMAAGTPVVATETAGAIELLGRNEAGTIVTKGDPVAIAEGISSVLAEPEAARNLANKARTVAKEEYSVEKMAIATEMLYKKVAGSD